MKHSKSGETVVFTHLTKEVLLFLILGGSCFLIWHDPKLRVGFTIREIILYIGLHLFRFRVSGLIVHSQPDKHVKKRFKYLTLSMPLLNLDLKKQKDAAKNAVSKSPEGAGQKKLKLLFFGRVLEYKGLHKYTKTYQDADGIELTIAGEIAPKFRSRLENIKNVIIRDEYIEDHEVDELFRNTDYVFMPYSDVTNTNVHTLAFEVGKPVIRSNLPGFATWNDVCSELIFSEGDEGELHRLFTNLPMPDSKEYSNFVDRVSDYFDKESRENSFFWTKLNEFVDQNKSI